MEVLLQPQADLVRLRVQQPTQGIRTKRHQGERAATQLSQRGVELIKQNFLLLLIIIIIIIIIIVIIIINNNNSNNNREG